MNNYCLSSYRHCPRHYVESPWWPKKRKEKGKNRIKDRSCAEEDYNLIRTPLRHKKTTNKGQQTACQRDLWALRHLPKPEECPSGQGGLQRCREMPGAEKATQGSVALVQTVLSTFSKMEAPGKRGNGSIWDNLRAGFGFKKNKIRIYLKATTI